MLRHQAHTSFAVGYKVNLNGNIILSISNYHCFYCKQIEQQERTKLTLPYKNSPAA